MKCRACLGKGCGLCHRTGQQFVGGWDESNERYTPATLIELARSTMTEITTDPASSEVAQRVVQAKTFYTYKENGLRYPWYGHVWCNPPFGYAVNSSTGYQELFTTKGIDEYNCGNMLEGIFLLNGNAPFREWFQNNLTKFPLCIYKGDVYFTKMKAGDFHHGFGTVFIYIGYRPEHFIRYFSQVGAVYWNK